MNQAEPKPTYRVVMTEQGEVTLPPEVCRHLPEGAVLEIHMESHGRMVIEVLGTHRTEDAWFYEEAWVQREHEASEDVRAGRITTVAMNEGFASLRDERRSSQ